MGDKTESSLLKAERMSSVSLVSDLQMAAHTTMFSAIQMNMNNDVKTKC